MTWHGTQHNPSVERTKKGIPKTPAGTLWVMGDLKQMKPEWIVGVSLRGYGISLAVGLGVPIPVLNEEMATFTGVADKDIEVPIVDYGKDYPNGVNQNYGFVTYEQLKTEPFNSMTKKSLRFRFPVWPKRGKSLEF
ncbi:MAG: homocysteine biosynthesis protein [Desulfobacterales bacterium]